ncbi:hypothetical protein MTE01_29260 [Microbacterium testaceum]|uniref:Uncharacterized protein n=1 Tax=Microbacterium testaceum TaxID=2033 RepID=A0A4Y3QPB4_MICTE|nr:hypothetical protein MTE01_29260 [Microbacterium testaceum]
MTLSDDVDRLAWAWVRLLVALGIGRYRRALRRLLERGIR